MRTLEKIYEQFADIVTGLEAEGGPDIGFHEICRRLKVAPDTLDEILVEELGMDGETYLEGLRRQNEDRAK